ncbi:MAG: 2-C-methyl-D-erythritol 4-phosphate cytidylyltransferase [Bacteroidales bacterium]|nr:2-C-methyl-D-erythritol 4-phosphate cytidylyltransferase [Bacteroidales bacterium]
MKRFAVVVAGGKGLRMNNLIPKQFLCLNGTPILMRTINRLKSFDPSISIIVVLPKEQIGYWKDLCSKHGFITEHAVTEGGSTRFLSVNNGLKMVENDSVVAIHDGVRPFISDSVLKSAYETAEAEGSAIPVIPLIDSIRSVDENGDSHAEDRSVFRLVQTPQVFRTNLIKDAFLKAAASDEETQSSFTDDASVFEYAGGKISLVGGDPDNIKITSPKDLETASVIVKKYE